METVTEEKKLSQRKQSKELSPLAVPPLSALIPQDQKTNLSNPKEALKMNKAHFILQKKGGVGKSVAASVLAQYLMSINEPVVVVDTDPSNATLHGYSALNGRRVQLMEGKVLNESKFDLLMNDVLQEESSFVIDCGASSFIPLNNYMIENNAVEMILDSGKEVYVHIVIAGKSHLLDTLSGLAEIVEQLPDSVSIVVWLNEFYGEIKVDGKLFYEMSVYLNNEDRIQGIVTLPQRSQMFKDDIEKMITLRLTFDEVRQSPEFYIMNKSRIHRVQQDIFRQLKAVL